MFACGGGRRHYLDRRTIRESQRLAVLTKSSEASIGCAGFGSWIGGGEAREVLRGGDLTLAAVSGRWKIALPGGARCDGWPQCGPGNARVGRQILCSADNFRDGAA